jgi:hypothetical protein
MNDPTVWQSILCDPTVPFDRDALTQVVRDQHRPSRRWLYPWLRHVSRGIVALIRFVKMLLPRASAHSTMDGLCIWFLRRFVSVDACSLLLRHFVVETNLLNFVVVNSRSGIGPVTLRPRTIADLGNRAVIPHDVNVYDVLIQLGATYRPSSPNLSELDFGMLDVPRLDPEPGRRRWLNLDIQSALSLMNIPFAACLTPAEYERAVHSMRLDDSLLTILAELTGDATHLRWRRGGVMVRVDSATDVPRAVYEHAVICEHAHERLRQLSRAISPPVALAANR